MDSITKSNALETKNKCKEEKLKSVTYNVVVRESHDYRDYKNIKMHFQLQQAEKRLKVNMDLTRMAKKEAAPLNPGLKMSVSSKQPRHSKLGKIKKRKIIDNVQDSGEKITKSKPSRKHKIRSPRLSKQLFSPITKDIVELTKFHHPEETIQEENYEDISNNYQSDNIKLISSKKFSQSLKAKTALFDKDSATPVSRHYQPIKLDTKDTSPSSSKQKLLKEEHKQVPEELSDIFISKAKTDEDVSQGPHSPTDLILPDHKTSSFSKPASSKLLTEESPEKIKEPSRIDTPEEKLIAQLSPLIQKLSTSNTVNDSIKLSPEIAEPEYKKQATYSIKEPEDSDTNELSEHDQGENVISDQILPEEISPVKSEEHVIERGSVTLDDLTEVISQIAPDLSSVIDKSPSESDLKTDVTEVSSKITTEQDANIFENLEKIEISGEDASLIKKLPEDSVDNIILEPKTPGKLSTESHSPEIISSSIDEISKQIKRSPESTEEAEDAIQKQPEDFIDKNIIEPKTPGKLSTESNSSDIISSSIDEISKQIKRSPESTEEAEDAIQKQPEDFIDKNIIEPKTPGKLSTESNSSDIISSSIDEISKQIKRSPESTEEAEDAIQKQPEDFIDKNIIEPETPGKLSTESHSPEIISRSIDEISKQIKISPKSAKDAIQEQSEDSINDRNLESETHTEISPLKSPSFEEISSNIKKSSEQIKMSSESPGKTTDVTKAGLEDSLDHKTSEPDTSSENKLITSPEEKLIAELKHIEENLQDIESQDLDLSIDDKISLLESCNESSLDRNISNLDIQQSDVIVDAGNEPEEAVSTDSIEDTLTSQMETNVDNSDSKITLHQKVSSISPISPTEEEKSVTLQSENINLAEQILPETERFIDPSNLTPPEREMEDLTARTADESSEEVQDQLREAAVERTRDDQSVTISEKQSPEQEETSTSKNGAVLTGLMTCLYYATQFILITGLVIYYYLITCIFYQKQIILWSLCMLQIAWQIGTERVKKSPNVTKLSALHAIWFLIGLYIKLLISMKGYVFAPILRVYALFI